MAFSNSEEFNPVADPITLHPLVALIIGKPFSLLKKVLLKDNCPTQFVILPTMFPVLAEKRKTLE